MKRKKAISILLILILVAGLCACGKKNNYSELEKLLDKGQYDAAITMIEGYKDDASRVPVQELDIEAKDQEFLNKIVGEYTYSNPFSTDSSVTMTIIISPDMVISLDDKSYPFEIKDNYIEYYITDEDGYKTRTTKSFTYIETYDYYTIYGYDRRDVLKSYAEEIWAKLSGNYLKSENGWGEYDTLSIGEDFTVTIDGETFPVYYQYSEFDDKINFMYKSPSNEYSTTLYYYISEDGLVCVFDSFLKEDQIEFVEITAENINTYFEWTDFSLAYVNKNAFNETTNFTIDSYYQLKDEYVSRYLSGFSKIALEVSYDGVYYPDVKLYFNASDETFSFDLGNISSDSYSSERNTITFSNLNTLYEYDENDVYSIKRVYLKYIDMQGRLTDSDTEQNGDNYTCHTYIYSGIKDGDPKVERSATTLAFSKTN